MTTGTWTRGAFYLDVGDAAGVEEQISRHHDNVGRKPRSDGGTVDGELTIDGAATGQRPTVQGRIRLQVATIESGFPSGLSVDPSKIQGASTNFHQPAIEEAATVLNTDESRQELT